MRQFSLSFEKVWYILFSEKSFSCMFILYIVLTEFAITGIFQLKYKTADSGYIILTKMTI